MAIKFSSLPSNSQRTRISECPDQVESAPRAGAFSKMAYLGSRLFTFLISPDWLQAERGYVERPGMKAIVVDITVGKDEHSRLDSVTARGLISLAARGI